MKLDNGRRLVALLLVCSAVGCCPDAVYEALVPAPAVRLPQDESPHCSGGEWWYYTGRLLVADGRSFGVEAVAFHIPGDLVFLPVEGWVTHLALLDETTGTFRYDQDRWLGPQVTESADNNGFDIYTPLIQMAGSDGLHHLRAESTTLGVALDVTLDDLRGAVLHGDNGYAPYGPIGQAFYYSRPRMQAAGTLTVSGQTHTVTGTFWFDRQWGREVTNPWITWDWFSLRLDDGVDIMLFNFPHKSRPALFGTYIPSVGDPVHLTAQDIAITPVEWWISPHTGRTYPVRWTVAIASQRLLLDVVAAVRDQEIDARATTLNVYWEGLCLLSGMRADQPVSGFAFVELANQP